MRRAVPDSPSATRAESHGPRSVEAGSRNGSGGFADAVVGEESRVWSTGARLGRHQLAALLTRTSRFPRSDSPSRC